MKQELHVMNILRLPPLGKLAIELGGSRYQSLNEIDDDKARRIVIAAIGEMIDFAGGYDALAQHGVAPPLKMMQPDEKPIETQQAEFLASLEAERDSLKDHKVSKGSILSGIQPETASRVDELVEQQTQRKLTIVEQIDEIIQGYLAQIPELSGRSVHLQQNPLGGLRIRVDNQYYDRPGDVEEKRIRLLIKKALKDWETNN